MPRPRDHQRGDITVTDNERIAEKIRRLIALSTSSNEHEAAAAAAKAQELLHKYNLTMAHVEAAERPDYIKAPMMIKHGGARWKFDLLSVISTAYGAEMVRTRVRVGKERSYYIIGQPHVIEVITYMFYYLEETIYTLSHSEYSRQWGRGMGRDFERTWRASFRKGCIDTIARRLREKNEELKRESSESRALILANDAAVKAALERYFPEAKPIKRSSSKLDGDGYWSGREKGKSIALNDALNGDDERPRPRLN